MTSIIQHKLLTCQVLHCRYYTWHMLKQTKQICSTSCSTCPPDRVNSASILTPCVQPASVPLGTTVLMPMEFVLSVLLGTYGVSTVTDLDLVFPTFFPSIRCLYTHAYGICLASVFHSHASMRTLDFGTKYNLWVKVNPYIKFGPEWRSCLADSEEDTYIQTHVIPNTYKLV